MLIELMCAVVAFIRFCNNSSLGLPTTGLKSLHTPKDNFDNNGSYQMGMDPLKLYGFSPADLGKVHCIFSHLTIFYSSSAVLIQSFLSTFSFYPPKYDYCRQSSIYWNSLVAIAKEKGEYIVVHGGGKGRRRHMTNSHKHRKWPTPLSLFTAFDGKNML